MCSWRWGLFIKALQIIHKHQASLGEVRLCLQCSFFTESGTTWRLPEFPISDCPCLSEAWVCEFQMSLFRLLKCAWFEEKEQWQLIDTEMAMEARLLPIKPLSSLSAGLSPVRPYFAVISQYYLIDSFQHLLKERRKIKSTWQEWKLRAWTFLWLSFIPKQASGREGIRA